MKSIRIESNKIELISFIYHKDIKEQHKILLHRRQHHRHRDHHMWAAIVKGTAKAGEFITQIEQSIQTKFMKSDPANKEPRCPWTGIVISEEEHEENKGNPNFHPKWRLRRNPQDTTGSPILTEKNDKKYSDQLLLERIRLWGKKNRFLHPPILNIESGVHSLTKTEQQMLSNFNNRGFSVASNNSGDISDSISISTIGFSIERQRLSAYNPWFICCKMEQKRPHLESKKNDICFTVPYNTPGDDSSIDLANLYLWPLLHSRSEEVVACRTFGDWKRLFYATIHLAFPSYHEWVLLNNTKSIFISGSEKAKFRMFEENVNPSRALYLISVKSNFWPYGHESYIPKWTVLPYKQTFTSSILKERLSEIEEMKRKYPKNAIFTVYKKTSRPSSANKDSNLKTEGAADSEAVPDREIVIEGGRNATGLCSVKKLKIHGDSAEITWFVNAKFLREMKRVHIFLEKSPWPKIHDDYYIFYN